MTILCDTNILSELARSRPHPNVLAWSEQIVEISLSVITLEEITYGLAAKPNPRIQSWFEQFLQTNCQILPVIDAIAHQCGCSTRHITNSRQTSNSSRYAHRSNGSSSSTGFGDTKHS